LFTVKNIYLNFIKPYLIYVKPLSLEQKQHILLELLLNLTKDLKMNIDVFLQYAINRVSNINNKLKE